MTFTRDSLATYEAQPQTTVADNVPPFEGTTNSAPPAATKQAAVDSAAPSGATDEATDLAVQGEGTSDANADSSAASADPSGETETDTGTAEAEGEEAPEVTVAPKKGSAAERIQEIHDLMSGYKEFGKLKAEENETLRAELAALKKQGNQTPSDTTPAPKAPPVVDKYPDLSDPDVNFDADKLREKTERYIDAKIEKGVQKAVQPIAQQTEADKIRTKFETNAATFAAENPDWTEVVVKNELLSAKSNQLSPVAAIAVAKSDFGPAIIHYFGKNLPEAARVALLPPDQQLLEIGEITATLKAAAKAAVKPVTPSKDAPVNGAKPVTKKSPTQAPPPPTPTRAANRADPREETDIAMSMDDFAKLHRDRRQITRQQNRSARGLK